MKRVFETAECKEVRSSIFLCRDMKSMRTKVAVPIVVAVAAAVIAAAAVMANLNSQRHLSHCVP